MNINNITLHNIRSYHHQNIAFPQGTTILSGNVGAGKSTILHAIEFALFGIMKGELTGEALLRNGSDQGSVTLDFTLDNNPISITRTLKRGSGVTQDTGSITINGKQHTLGATELKQAIITLLHYPQEYLKKSKNLIYRYTVYTPQEAMKHILFADTEERIDILRKVFGIDKYKRIQENTTIILSTIKDKRKTNHAKTEDLPLLEERQQHLAKELQTLRKELALTVPQQEKLQHHIEQLQEQQLHLEQTADEEQKLTTQKAVLQHTITTLQHLLQETEKELATTIPALQDPKEQQLHLQEHLNQRRQELQHFQQELTKHTLIIQQQQTLMKDITILHQCPTCKQEVTPEHKHAITTQSTTLIATEEKTQHLLTKNIKDHERQLSTLQEQLLSLQHQATAYALSCQQHQEQEKKRHHHENILQQLEKAQQSLTLLTEKLRTFTPTAPEASLTTLRQELQALQDHERQLAITNASITTTIHDYEKEQEHLHTTITHKHAIRRNNEKLQELQTHLETIFLSLVQAIEKQTMLRVHHDFSTTFNQWFSLLMDTTVIDATINHDYQPVITQNGYTIDYEHLSGGEKTACALAYRLALNHVINTLMDTIKTRDLLILDEPTDGFSEEQLDKLKNVLDEVNAQQVIIVSHENKIESFVNNIIRITKKEHTSEVS